MINPKLHRYVKDLTPEKNYLVTEFIDNYEDGVMARRDLLERVYHITGSTAAAAATLLAMGVKPAFADPLASAEFRPVQQTGPTSPLSVPANDPAVVAGPVTFPSGSANIMAYWARPNRAGRVPIVLICHENRGTGVHYEDVTRRFAKAGYAAIILDLLSRQGGTSAVAPNDIGGILTAAGARDQFVADFRAALAFMRRQTFTNPDRAGMTGYCYGGGITYLVVAAEPTLRAAAPYYGPVMDAAALRSARAAVLGVYGETDANVNASIPAVQEALTAAGVAHRINRYPAGHAFYNDTNPNSYNEAASLAAWRDTLAWFQTYLVAGAAALPSTGTGPSLEEEITEAVAE